MKRGQISTEFLFAIGTVVIIFLIILAFSFERRNDIKDTESSLSKKNECLKISNFITEIFIGGEGALANAKIGYDVSIQGEARMLCVDNDFCCSFPINRVSKETGPIGNGNIFSLTKGDIILKNINNYVVIKNV